MKYISFHVPGLPATQGSKRFLGKGRVVDSCRRLPEWRSAVAYTAKQAYSGDPLSGAVTLCIAFVLPRPKSHYRTGKNAHLLRDAAPVHHVTTPDLTKMTRAVEDALKGIVWRDDSQVVEQETTKGYCKICNNCHCQHVGAWVTIVDAERDAT